MFEHVPRLIGQALRGARAGMESIIYFDKALGDVAETIVVGSPKFEDGRAIPAEFTADGVGVSPPLSWTGMPSGALSVVLVIEDPDAPSPRPLVHGIVWNLPADEAGLQAGDLGNGSPAKLGRNSFLASKYLPPDPPKGHGIHRYAFQVFAIDRSFRFDGSPGRNAIFDAMRMRMLARGLLMGTYERR